MPNPVLHYIYDPLCGWCYAAAPMVEAVRAAGVPVALHGGGLWAEPTRLPPGKAAYIREADARIAALTGQPFGEAYLDGLLCDPATTLWSAPPTAAVLAAGRARQGAELDMLHAIQHGHYVEGRRVVDAEALADLAVSVGLDRSDFERGVDAEATARHIGATRALMQRSGVSGFPGFLLETPEATVRLSHEAFYGRPAAFAAAVREAAHGPH